MKKEKVGRKRKKSVFFYLHEEEFEILKAKADESGMTQSEFLRNMIMIGAAHERTMFSKDGQQRLIKEINKIGNNLNQIAVKANANNVVDDRDFENLYHNYLDLLGVFDEFIRGNENGYY